MQITVDFDPHWLDELKARLDPRKIPQAITASANKTAGKTKTLMRDEAAKELNLSKKDISATMRVNKANYASLSADVIVDRQPIALSKYPVKQTPTGVLATPRRTEPGKIEPGQRPYSFLGTLASGHVGVFDRFGPKVAPSKGRYAGKIVTRGPNKGRRITRQMLDQRYGPTVAGVLAGKPGMKEKFKAFVEEDLPKQMESQVHRFLDLKPVETDA